MALKFPSNTAECVYFTRRNIGKGKAIAWVLKELCTKCKKGIMGKPKGDDGKTKIRAKEYVCPECDYTVPKDDYEDTLTVSIQYTCPHCNFSGEGQTSFKRKKIKIFDEESGKEKAADAIRFECAKCKKNIDITKKMK